MSCKPSLVAASVHSDLEFCLNRLDYFHGARLLYGPDLGISKYLPSDMISGLRTESLAFILAKPLTVLPGQELRSSREHVFC
jgi:hypothetical protein